MSDYNMPIIEPTVDYTKVPPINQKRTIAFINHFIAHTITFLNKFALSCEEKLFEFENKIQRVEASLEILEARLSSIPIENEPPAQNIEIEDKTKEEEVKKIEVDAQETDEPDNKVPNEPKIEETDTQPVHLDPRYATYFKMIHVGVPKQAVKLKMEIEGLDSSVLDNPNQLIPKLKPANDSNVNADS